MSKYLRWSVWLMLSLSFPALAETSTPHLQLVGTSTAWLCLIAFIVAYLFVATEEWTQLHKSKPVLIAAGIIWFAIGLAQRGSPHAAWVEQAFSSNLEEYGELLLFLLVAMTYINAMEDRRVFDKLRCWLVSKKLSYRALFWLTGILAFVISPVADNMTTALLMCAVVVKVAKGEKRFINMACINIVIGANAGGAFSPFGDITTLMVWQKGVVEFNQFFDLFIPAVVNFVIPAAIMTFFIPRGPVKSTNEDISMQRGGKRIIALFVLTIVTAVYAHNSLELPPVMGMMFGLGYLQLMGFYLRLTFPKKMAALQSDAHARGDQEALSYLGSVVPFNVFNRIAKAEWDTLLFFYGVVMCVGGLGFVGYLELASNAMYANWNPTYANIVVGLLSSVVDNIPVMFAVLTMHPAMSLGQWLLVTMTAGIGGSLLSIGSAAGVALMGQARGMYTFFGHLRWFPVIALGYIGAIAVHIWLNAALF
ncbi:sodium:proton antiporter NhaD [Celerinatantimonas sp. MCCC 1A17872]|uniref:sodium:proton antiporter NhaD n=1 Tax=Celerinatantimonas sp. MCCC 1A17872 TaxID=3177514 RepID=UPI0038C10A7A